MTMVGERAHGNVFVVNFLITSAYFSCSAFLFIVPVRRVLIKVVEGVLDKKLHPQPDISPDQAWPLLLSNHV